jgi:hypothetical protein
MLDARLHALEQPRRLQQCAQSGLGRNWKHDEPPSRCVRWNVVQFDEARQ